MILRIILCAILVSVLASADLTLRAGTVDLDTLTVDQWRADLAHFIGQLPGRYGGDLSSIHWRKFKEASSELDGRVASFSPSEIVAGMMRLAAMQADEATLIWPFQPAIGMRILPVQAYWFDDGAFVTRADEEYGYIVGSRLARIGGHTLDAVFELFTPLISAENTYHKKWWFFVYGFCPELLHALGVNDSPDFTRLTLVDKKGATYEVDVSGVSFTDYARRFFTSPVTNEPSPIITNRRARDYRFEILPQTRALYIQLNEIRDQKDSESMDAFVARLIAFADTASFDRTIVDLRRRGGGSGHLAVPFADAIGRHDKLNRRGRLFALIGRSTSGPVLELASMLEYRTTAIFVGESTGEGPNGVGDSQTFTLPNSGIEVYFTDRFWPTSIPEDNRRWIAPDVRAGYSNLDFFEGKDPVLEAARRYRVTRSAEQRVHPEEAEQIAGRYLFTPHQILTVVFDAKGDGALSFSLTDFIETSFFDVRSAMYRMSSNRFETDIEGLTIDAAMATGRSVEQLFIDWKGHKMMIGRAPLGFKLPVELIRDGRIEAGVTALLVDGGSRSYYEMTAGWFLDETGHRLLEEVRVDEAILVFGANTTLYPDDVDAWESLAEGYLSKGDAGQAERCFKKILEVDPDNEKASELLKRLEERRSR